MPSKSKKQEKFMRAACHSADVRKGKISKAAACEYAAADKAMSTRGGYRDLAKENGMGVKVLGKVSSK